MYFKWDAETKQWVLNKKHVDTVRRIAPISPFTTKFIYFD